MLELNEDDFADCGWNGRFPSARQWRLLVMYVLTPARSPKYGARLNAWRVGTGREPLSAADIDGVRRMLGVRARAR